MLTRALGRVRIPRSRIQGSNYSNGFLKDSKLGPIGVSCRRWLSNESGKRFAAMWGSGDYGRLGLGNLESQWTPSVCSALSDHSIRAVACGGAHTLFLTGDFFISRLALFYLVIIQEFWNFKNLQCELVYELSRGRRIVLTIELRTPENWHLNDLLRLSHFGIYHLQLWSCCF